jgi:hypothetical protein
MSSFLAARPQTQRLDRFEAAPQPLVQRSRGRPLLRPRLEAAVHGRLAGLALHRQPEPDGETQFKGIFCGCTYIGYSIFELIFFCFRSALGYFMVAGMYIQTQFG